MMIGFKRRKKHNEKAEEFIRANPTVAKIELQGGSTYQGTVSLLNIDGKEDFVVIQGVRYTALIMPGEHTLEAQAFYERKNIITKRVTRTIVEPQKFNVTIEASKEYIFGYSVDDNIFTFEEK